jgi:hypothetical protein
MAARLQKKYNTATEVCFYPICAKVNVSASEDDFDVTLQLPQSTSTNASHRAGNPSSANAFKQAFSAHTTVHTTTAAEVISRSFYTSASR